jgi:hypothetical protein
VRNTALPLILLIILSFVDFEAEKTGLIGGDVRKKAGNFDVRDKEDLYNAIFFCCHDAQITQSERSEN